MTCKKEKGAVPQGTAPSSLQGTELRGSQKLARPAVPRGLQQFPCKHSADRRLPTVKSPCGTVKACLNGANAGWPIQFPGTLDLLGQLGAAMQGRACLTVNAVSAQQHAVIAIVAPDVAGNARFDPQGNGR